MITINLLDYIDTRQGTKNQYGIGHGNTLPYTTVPFGMNSYVIQTRLENPYFFHPDDYFNYGVRLTHQPSPWMGDFAYLTINAFSITNEENDLLEKGYYSSINQIYSLIRGGYHPDKSVFKPHYLKYKRMRDLSTFELVPTERGASIMFRPDNIELPQMFSVTIACGGQLELSDDRNNIIGYTNQLSGSKYDKFGMHFMIKSSCKMEFVWTNADNSKDEGNKTYLFRLVTDSKEIGFDIVTSYISLNQAVTNYSIDDFFQKNFTEKIEDAADKWLNYLNRIVVQHPNSDYLKTFYTCLYRTATFPQLAYDCGRDGEPVHYSPYTQKVEQGVFYTNNGYWDTFRTNYPLYSLIIPEKISEFLEGIINVAREDKYLPKWLSPDERGLMPGTLVDGVIADAICKKLIDKEMAEEFLDHMIYTATVHSEHELEGREGFRDYDLLGYLPSDYHESVNKTLDYAYSDFCIAQVASALNKDDIADKFYKRSKNYQNLFDATVNQMMPKNRQGKFEINNPYTWGNGYTEGSAWQSSLSVYHDISGLIELYGGDAEMYNHLSHLINMIPRYNVGGYHQEIHEMLEMAKINLGQLAISNQPSFHIPYLFNYIGLPNLTQIVIKIILSEFFSYDETGFVGDEDNGSLSSWFVLSSLGLYQVTPGVPEYNLGISLWDYATVKVGDKVVTIETINNENYLSIVSERKVNQKTYKNIFISYFELMQGVEITQQLGLIPNINLTPNENRPYSLSSVDR